MFHYLHLRSRFLQTLILALVGLTFYAYYRTAVYDVRQYSLPRNTSYPAYQDGPHAHVNLSQSRNSTSDGMSLNPYAAHNASNSSLIFVTTLSTSSSAQSSSSSSSVSTLVGSKQSGANERPQMARAANVTRSAPIVAVRNDSARAIYEAGHTVSIPERCPHLGGDMDLVVIVMSAPTHLEARTAIRQTWGHFGQRSDMSVLFMLGTTFDARVEAILRKEQNMYNDVIRGRFLDSYSNLTLKTISTLEWVDTYCPKVKYLLKTDDDMFINVPRLLAFVYKHAKDRNVIFGRLARKWKPIRNRKSKYYVSQAQFQQPVFPDFTTGPAYLLSSDTVRRLYDAALDQTYLKLEDVFTTGIVAHRLGIRRSHANEFLNKRIQYTACNIQRGISIHMVKYSEQFDLWKKLLDGKSKCKR
ncbi:PREDICTED: beta-1,3-galactosyltransferase 5-like [Vollenhovia emeryi]|uniref:beta-1,3-galactosyltransferase 5-like n=1 Tax=Vollenhovia emeryi TaxID=411798 RepID=UPI0005F38378|nr:PREDICTED: beta-1,3-galactosyltransferase 5-like [Vollenhovia emeryi]